MDSLKKDTDVATSEHIAIGKCFIYSLFQLNLSHLHLQIS